SRRLGEQAQVESQEPVRPDLQQHTGEQDRARRRRLGVGIGEPGMQREQRDLHGEGDEERQEEPARGLHRQGRRDEAQLSGGAQSNVAAPDAPDFANRNRTPPRRNAAPAIVNRKNLIAAYTRLPPPQPPMIRYIGTSTASKNKKNNSRSSARNVPSTAVSRT